MRLYVPIIGRSTGDTLEKARAGLVYRTDLPYKKPDGSSGYRKGWVLPADAKAIDNHKKAGGFADELPPVKVQQTDMLDEGEEGDAWGHRPAAVVEQAETTEKAPEQTTEAKPLSVEAGGDKYTADRVDGYLELPVKRKLELARAALERGGLSGIPIDPEHAAVADILKMTKWCMDNSDGDGAKKGFNIRGWQNAKVRAFLSACQVADQKAVNTFQTAFGTLEFSHVPKFDSFRIDWHVGDDSTGVFETAVNAAATGPGAYDASTTPDETIPVGTTKTENGVTYILGLTHRWERLDGYLGGNLKSVASEKGWEGWLTADAGLISEKIDWCLGQSAHFPMAAFLAHILYSRKFFGQTVEQSEVPIGNLALTEALATAPEVVTLETPDGTHYVEKTAVIDAVTAAGGDAAARVQKMVEAEPERAHEALKHLAEGLVRRDLLDGRNEAEDAAREMVQIDPPQDLSGPSRAIQGKISEADFRDYGSWSANGKNLSAAARKSLNESVAAVLLKPQDEITPDDLDKVRRYSGFGGVDAEGERGVLYDYYTSPPMAKMCWQLLNKISPVQKGAEVLEPACGTGVFFEVAPDGVGLTGAEYDVRTAGAANLLQGHRATVHTGAFEQFNLHNDKKFTHVVGNCPFGTRSIATSFMDDPGEKNMDRYFLRRSMDNLADGGALSMIAASGPLTAKESRDWRLDMMRQGQFMGAYQLPNKSFKHTQTGVQPVVYLFRKYPEEVRSRLAGASEKVMLASGFVHDDFLDGSYLEKNPDNRLGEWDENGGRFGSGELTGDLTPDQMDGVVTRFSPEPLTTEHWQALHAAIPTPKGAGGRPVQEMKLNPAEAAAFAAKTLAVGMTKTVDGKVYRLNENHRWELMEGLTEDGVKKLNAVQDMARKVKAVRAAMQAGEPVDALQAETRALYEAFEAEYGCHPRDDREVKSFTRDNYRMTDVHEAMSAGLDSDVLTMANLYDKDVELKDGFKPEIKRLLEVQKSLQAATPALLKELYPNEYESLTDAMATNPDVFADPAGTWYLREDYIYGNAWEKIDDLQAAIENDPENPLVPKWELGIAALKDAVGWVTIEEIDSLPTASWLPVTAVMDWAEENGGRVGQDVDGKWFTLNDRWESKRIQYFLNGHKQKEKHLDTEVYKKDSIESWKSWLANTPMRGQLEELYNRAYNTEIFAPTKTYSVDLEGWNPNIVIKPHQWQSIHHLYREGKGISALGTGFGKTTAAIGLMALLRQEGRAKRVFLQVPNNKVADWVAELSGRDNPNPALCVKARMPGLKVGYINPAVKDKTPAERYRAYQELANGDFDVIVMPESCASEIQLRAENDAKVVEKFAEKQGKASSKSKRSEAQDALALENQMTAKKKNLTVNFEDFGCDAMVVDEFHGYKNLFSSSLSREIGMADGRNSQRAMALLKKSDYIRSMNDGKNFFGLTATPLSNSPLEYFNMIQHVAPEAMEKLGIDNIDEFINNFADVHEDQVYDWSTGQLKAGKVVKGFRALRTLQDVFFKYTDLQNDAKAIKLEKPNSSNKPNILEQNADTVGALKAIAEEYEAFKESEQARKSSGTSREEAGEHRTDLTFWQAMRTASLDLELYDPVKYKGWKSPKLEALATNALRIQRERGGGQAIFCDRVMSGNGFLNMHDKIKAALVAKGVKPEEVVIVNGITKAGGKMSESATEQTVADAVDGFNTGKYKYILGTTQTLGEGVNLQHNSSALHHVDIPFRPSDMIQRNGRVDRQGNQQGSVELHTYLGKGTLDAGSVALVQRKANWIDQMLKTKSSVFANPEADGSQVDMEEIMAGLQESWGDSKSAEARRQLLAEKRAEAEKQARSTAATENLAQLSLLRGALRTYTGKPDTPEFQARLRKVELIGRALHENPEFNHADLVTQEPPNFIYDKKGGTVYREGDHFEEDGRFFRLDSIDHKKQAFTAHWIGGKPVDTWEARSTNRYGWSSSSKPNEKHVTWTAKDGFSGWYAKPAFLPGQLNDSLVKDTAAMHDSKVFDSLGPGDKARLWDQHAKVSMGSSSYMYEDGSGQIVHEERPRYSDEDTKNRRLNPFDEKDRAKLLEHIRTSKGPYRYGDLSDLVSDSRTVAAHSELSDAVTARQSEDKARRTAIGKSLADTGPRLMIKLGDK